MKVEFFVPGKLVNPLNGTHGHWAAGAAIRKRLRRDTHVAALAVRTREHWDSTKPKRVTFAAQTWNAMDSDGLQAALKPARDGLVDAGMIHGDSPASGHTFVYRQVIDRKRRGVTVTVETA